MFKYLLVPALAAIALPSPVSAAPAPIPASASAEVRLDHISVVKLGKGPPVVLRPALAGLKIPVTVVVPWTEAQFGKDRTLAFYRRQYAPTPATTYADIPDSGHFVMLDQPELFRAALDAFLGR